MKHDVVHGARRDLISIFLYRRNETSAGDIIERILSQVSALKSNPDHVSSVMDQEVTGNASVRVCVCVFFCPFVLPIQGQAVLKNSSCPLSFNTVRWLTLKTNKKKNHSCTYTHILKRTEAVCVCVSALVCIWKYWSRRYRQGEKKEIKEQNTLQKQRRRLEERRAQREERRERVGKGRDDRKNKKASAHGPATLTSCHRTRQLFSARTLEEKKKKHVWKCLLERQGSCCAPIGSLTQKPKSRAGRFATKTKRFGFWLFGKTTTETVSQIGNEVQLKDTVNHH